MFFFLAREGGMGPKCLEGSGINKNAVGPVFVGSTSMGSTNYRSKRLKKKQNTPEGSKKQNLNLPLIGNYIHRIYIIFKIIYKLINPKGKQP